MEVNLASQYVALLFMIIIMTYSRGDHLLPTLKNSIFRIVQLITVTILLVAIVGTHLREFGAYVPLVFFGLSKLFLYLAVPLTALLFLQYMIAVIWEDSAKVISYLRLSSIPYVIYALAALTTPVTNFLFDFQNPLLDVNRLTLFLGLSIGLFYVCVMLLIVMVNRKQIDSSLIGVFLFYPAITITLPFLQLVTEMVPSGIGSTATILIIYLYLQNKRLVIDTITGLQNRTAFLKVLEFNLKKKSKLDIVLVSLDNFKLINDKYGQNAGDHFLQEVGNFLTTVIPLQHVYRYSGDEFALILEKGIKGPTWDQATNEIRTRFLSQWEACHRVSRLTASIIVVNSHSQANSVEELISLLEYCTAQAKQSGKNKVVIADPNTVEKLKRKSYIAEAMKSAMANGSFEVYYQPVYSMKKGKLTSAEALLRFSDHKLGRVSPAEFIPIAEETGTINQIFFYVLDQVCQYIRRLQSNGIEVDAISVNCSATQIFQENLVEDILKIIGKHEVDAKKIRLEITEGVFIDNIEYVSDIMYKLKASGIEFYLDDFGTGYSNLATIMKLPFEYIKIDKSLLYEAERNEKSFGIIKSLANTFANNGMEVVVEGVENPNQENIVEKISADYIQGYLYATPMSASAAIDHLKTGVVT